MKVSPIAVALMGGVLVTVASVIATILCAAGVIDGDISKLMQISGGCCFATFFAFMFFHD